MNQTTQIEYKIYRLSFIEYLLYGTVYLSISAIVAFLFYDSFIPVTVTFPLILIYYKYISRFLCKKRKERLLLQFRDMLHSISASLNSGYSIENSIKEAKNEMIILYGKTSYICNELDFMSKKLAINIPIEKIFSDFSVRSQCNDIIMFSQILMIAKRNGGDLIAIIKSSSQTIGEKIDINREIATALSSRKYEQNIMFLMPIVIMIYIRLSSDGFFAPVYHNITGVLIMSVCLMLYILAVVSGLKLSTVNI